MGEVSKSWVIDLLNKVMKKREVYSLNEQRIGTWIDGKPLYRKVVDIGNLPNNSTKNVNSNIENLDNITKLYGIGARNDGYIYPLPLLNNSLLNTCVMITYTKKDSGGIIDIRSYTDYSTSKGLIIIEYTKTTD